MAKKEESKRIAFNISKSEQNLLEFIENQKSLTQSMKFVLRFWISQRGTGDAIDGWYAQTFNLDTFAGRQSSEGLHEAFHMSAAAESEFLQSKNKKTKTDKKTKTETETKTEPKTNSQDYVERIKKIAEEDDQDFSQSFGEIFNET